MKGFTATVVGLLVLAACGSGGERTDATAPDAHEQTYAAVCMAATEAASGALVEARQLFIDDAHDGLHDLARQVERVDRATSARLLEVKQLVEADLSTLSESLGPNLAALVERTGLAIVALGLPEPQGCST